MKKLMIISCFLVLSISGVAQADPVYAHNMNQDNMEPNTIQHHCCRMVDSYDGPIWELYAVFNACGVETDECSTDALMEIYDDLYDDCHPEEADTEGTDSDGLENWSDDNADGVHWQDNAQENNDDADTDEDALNVSEDPCPWGSETDDGKCVVVIKLEDLFPRFIQKKK